MNLDIDTLVAAQAQHIVTLSDEAHALKRELEEVTKHCDENRRRLERDLAGENERSNRLATQINELDGALKNANARIEALDFHVDTQGVMLAAIDPLLEAQKIAKRILAGDVTPAPHTNPVMWAYVAITLAHQVTYETIKHARAYYNNLHDRMSEIMFMQLAVDLNYKLFMTKEFRDYAKQYEGVYRAAGDSRIERAKRVWLDEQASPTRAKRKPKLANTSKRRVTKGNEAR